MKLLFWRYLQDVKILERSNLFDRSYYSQKYKVPQFLAAAHFAKKEHRENSPSAVFSSRQYYKLYPDVHDAGANALVHYIRNGKAEGRIYKSENDCELYDYFFVQTLFDIDFYAKKYMTQDERKTVNPIEHYSREGWKQGNLPNQYFDLDAFQKKYPKCDTDPLLYCLKYRIPEIFTTEPASKIKLGYQAGAYQSYIEMLKQDSEIQKTYPDAANCERLIWFWMTDQDCISGGLMSMCGIYDICRKLSSQYGYEVIASTLPTAGDYRFKYSLFDNDIKIFRYDQVVYYFPSVKEILIMLPEIYIREVYHYLFSKIDGYLTRIPIRRLNIMNQNIELMPYEFEVDRLKRYFTSITQTTAHKSYTTQRHRDLYGVPIHQVLPPIKKNIVVTAYEKKENIFLYSPDEHPYKSMVLQRLHNEFPSMKFIEIRNIPFRDYLKLISRAKWAMSFGEGLDGYFTEPYAAGGIAFTVWHKEFFTDEYKGLPTILNSYEEAVDTLPALMRSLDHKKAYEKMNEDVMRVWRKEYDGDKTSEDMIKEFLLGKFDFS